MKTRILVIIVTKTHQCGGSKSTHSLHKQRRCPHIINLYQVRQRVYCRCFTCAQSELSLFNLCLMFGLSYHLRAFKLVLDNRGKVSTAHVVVCKITVDLYICINGEFEQIELFVRPSNKSHYSVVHSILHHIEKYSFFDIYILLKC